MTVFLAHGLFFGETLLAVNRQFSFSISFLGGEPETLKLIRDLALCRKGECGSDDLIICFSLFLHALSSLVSGINREFFLESVTGVLGSVKALIFLGLVSTAVTISRANRLAKGPSVQGDVTRIRDVS